MKKTYIIPEIKAFNLTSVSFVAMSAINEEGNGEYVKEEQPQSGDDMWNLYDK